MKRSSARAGSRSSAVSAPSGTPIGNPIGKKQTTGQAEWMDALGRIDEVFPRPALDRLVDETVERVRHETRGKRVAFGWSGGKDSLVLEGICRAAGIDECVLVITELEYPEFLRWATDNMPPGLYVYNSGLDLDWLERHPEMLFPANSTIASRWFKQNQHKGQRDMFRRWGLDMIALGRRKADGNYIGSPDGIYTNREGITRYSPIRDWSHEAVLAYIKANRISLPPNYFWPRGFRVGTGPWPARQWTKGVDHGFAEVWTIDPDIIRTAARSYRRAAEWMERAGVS